MNQTSYKRIDLHLHTMISDGTDTLEQLLTHLREEEIDLFSVTDHDAIKGGSLVPGLLKGDAPAFIRGVEFSCRDDLGKYHILGYGYDPDRGSILDLVQRGHALRMAKTSARIAHLQESFGMEFPQEEIQEILNLDNPGKPHIATMMIRHGYADSISEGIAKYLNGQAFRTLFLDPGDAIEAIISSGGIPVLAHPTYGSGDELILGEEMEQRLLRLMKHGLAGLEAFYSGFTRKIRQELLGLAEKYDLYVTAGSDYHGENKMVQMGDTGLTDMDSAPPGLNRFLQDVQIITGE